MVDEGGEESGKTKSKFLPLLNLFKLHSPFHFNQKLDRPGLMNPILGFVRKNIQRRKTGN